MSSPPPSPSPRAFATTLKSFPYLPTLLLFLFEFAELVLVSPRIRLLESRICREHYDSAGSNFSLLPPSESNCKISPIQIQLAYIRGWQVFFEAIPVMALAVPWGALADRVGRKRVLVVNFAGCALHILWFLVVCHPTSKIPVKAVWASAIAFALGGGPRTGGILILALVTDTSSGIKRSERFYYTYSAFLITELIAPPISAMLMFKNLLYPFIAALLSLTLALLVLNFATPSYSSNSASRPSHSADPEESRTLLLTNASSTSQNPLRFLLHLTPAVRWVLLGHLICPVRQELVFQILIPYASRRFNLPISKAGLILSLIALSNLLSVLLALPVITRRLRFRGHSPAKADSLIARGSSALLAVACVFLGAVGSFPAFVVGAAVFAAGFGIRLALLSLLTGLVKKEEVGRTYTLVTVVEGFGEMISAPVLQGVWSTSLRAQGDEWMGCVWWVGALAYGAAVWIIGKARIR